LTTHKVICLLPVRNVEGDLPGYFESVEQFADAILALDDGSTDRTKDLLEANPLVKLVLSNPVRSDYVGWDDAGNRNRLLEAATEFSPEWIISLDADERIPADDALALREFLDADAMPGIAYGFTVFRMRDDMEHFDRSGLWVYRLFAFEPGQRFPDKRLHFAPIPTSIPRELWVRTTIRIQHLAGLTDARRQARFAKYAEADPDNEFQHSYRDLLNAAGDVTEWKPRPEGRPVLAVRQSEVAIAMEDAEHPSLDEIEDRPALSAVIISRGDGERILPGVRSVVGQACSWSFEVIVVTSGPGTAADLVRAEFPQVTVIELAKPALPGEARNAGLRAARGEYVSFPGSHVELLPGSFEARLRAHDLGYSMVTGSVRNGTDTRSGWASYFMDQSGSLPARPSGELQYAPSHCSYRRSALESVRGFPEHMRAGEDTIVNQELFRLGHRAYRAQDAGFIHVSPCRTPIRLVRHHFVRGRAMGRILRDRDGVSRRSMFGQVGLKRLRIQSIQRARRISESVEKWGDEQAIREYRECRMLIALGIAANCAGTWFEFLRSSRREPIRP
jgi:glycosyltransferase involved in cell wall biosynthesis